MTTIQNEVLPEQTASSDTAPASVAVENTDNTEASLHTADAESREEAGQSLGDGERAEGEAESADIQREGESVDEETGKYIFSQLREINERFPDIKSVHDIVRLGKYKDIKEKIRSGYSISDAVRLVYEDEYINSRLAKAQAQARREMVSASHLSATGASGASFSDISERDIRTFMQAIPTASREDAIRAYQKYKIGK